MPEFVHLHCHTQFSLLDGASDIATMMDKAVADGMKGVALTDHGNMFGAFKFVAEAEKRGIKPIVGCEFYLVEDRHVRSFKGTAKDRRYHQLLLAKNQEGYENLSKLCSLGFTEGLYSKYPRVDKELIVKYHKGLIASSCCIGAEIPQLILEGQVDKAEKALRWWLDLFGEDFYIELQRHKGLENIDGTGISQEDVNQTLLGFAKKYNLKVIATNDSHYVEEEDNLSHDILLCINTGELLESEKRFKFPSSDFYFKTQAEMNQLFADVPFAIDTTMEIFDKIDTLKLARNVLLPAFPLPPGFKDQDEYLRFLTYEGAKRRYGIITPEIQERLDFELNVIAKSGYPGYFLIVQDFTTVARQMDVWVGPGRGSAAGSAVAYCVGITNVDPIKYDLLFERFLNPERVSMPDIDIDFDDEGRERIINYVVDKYGQNQVAQIITYGSMAAKSSIRDVGRVMNMPLPEVDKIAKTFPDDLSASLKKVLAKDDVDAKLKDKLNSEELAKAYEFRRLAEGDDLTGQVIRTAKKLEGSIRNTGIHACGVVITPDDITRYVPVSTAKDSSLLVTQFDNSVAENAGLLKMDFLGLKTLTIIKDAIKMVKQTKGIEIDPDGIPLDDPKTYELFQRGETVAIFQYESTGMQKYLRELAPTKFEDLIAMNALYRPGPLEYIPNFVARKHGREPIVYDLPDMEEYLKDTYGITVYQEQVMLLSQKLADFTKGQADALRKAMGKKQKAIIDKMWPEFLKGGTAKGHPEPVLQKIWKDWEAFASYAFNKSHSTCYAYLAFHTAYLKAHHPAEFMASVLSHNRNDITKIQFFLGECKAQNVDVLGPDANESGRYFAVNKQGKIRFGLAAVKGIGDGPVEEILRAREEGGPFLDIFDFMRRVSLRTVNKKCLESMILSGAFDLFGLSRAQYFASYEGKEMTVLEALMRYGNNYQKQQNDSENSLFGEVSDSATEIEQPKFKPVEEWPLMEKLGKEKEVVGIFISGHPLDDYRLEVQRFAKPISNLHEYKNRELSLAGILTSVREQITKKGTAMGRLMLEDYEGQIELTLFTEAYQKFQSLLKVGNVLLVKGKYDRRWNSETEFEFKVLDINLLDSYSDKAINSIALRLPIEQLDEQWIERLERICQQYPGPHQLQIDLVDLSEKVHLPLISELYKVKADSLLANELERLGISYQLK